MPSTAFHGGQSAVGSSSARAGGPRLSLPLISEEHLLYRYHGYRSRSRYRHRCRYCTVCPYRLYLSPPIRPRRSSLIGASSHHLGARSHSCQPLSQSINQPFKLRSRLRVSQARAHAADSPNSKQREANLPTNQLTKQGSRCPGRARTREARSRPGPRLIGSLPVAYVRTCRHR